MKVCKVCGKEFKPKANQQTCSNKCSLINKKKTKKAQYKSVEPKLCKMCGKEFTPKGAHVTCGKGCSKANKRQSRRRSWNKIGRYTDDKYKRKLLQINRRIAERVRKRYEIQHP